MTCPFLEHACVCLNRVSSISACNRRKQSSMQKFRVLHLLTCVKDTAMDQARIFHEKAKKGTMDSEEGQVTLGVPSRRLPAAADSDPCMSKLGGVPVRFLPLCNGQSPNHAIYFGNWRCGYCKPNALCALLWWLRCGTMHSRLPPLRLCAEAAPNRCFSWRRCADL